MAGGYGGRLVWNGCRKLPLAALASPPVQQELARSDTVAGGPVMGWGILIGAAGMFLVGLIFVAGLMYLLGEDDP